MKQSSWAERLVAFMLVAVFAMLSWIASQTHAVNREMGETIILIETHIANHPNTAIEEDVSDLERWRFDHERRGHSPTP